MTLGGSYEVGDRKRKKWQVWMNINKHCLDKIIVTMLNSVVKKNDIP